MSAIHDDSSVIISRMRELRSTGQRDVNQLHAQAERVTDWREHVRAQPVLSAIASAVVGYSIVRAVAGKAVPNQPLPVAGAHLASITKPKSSSMGLLSLVGGLAASVGRQWVTEYIKKQLGGHAHGANQSTHAQQRSNDSSETTYPR